MELRWSHEGVSLRAPVRNARGFLRLGYAMIGAAGLLTVAFFSQLAEPEPVPDYAQCAWRSARHVAGPCQELRPSFETWDYATEDEYVFARACTLAKDFDDADLVTQTRANAGIGYIGNLEFLRMAAHQSGTCVVEWDGFREQAEREWDALVAIEHSYWSDRIERATIQAETTFTRASFIRRVLLDTVPLWLPLLLLGWIAVLTLFKRLLRSAEPLELHVHTAGLEIDGRRIPRDDIAFLTLEGQRLRVERWLGPPVFSRALPPEALAHADEICGALGLLQDDEPTSDEPAPASLRALVSGVRRASE
jgi:hypothetical protein